MMKTFEPGRIYSGVVPNESKPRLLVFDGQIFHGGRFGRVGRTHWGVGEITDIRGPLVVLDLDPTETEIVCVLLARSTRPPANKAADQIEKQIWPPLQVGWHEVESPDGEEAVRNWTGTEWQTPSGEASVWQNWSSVYYIGPASDDQS